MNVVSGLGEVGDAFVRHEKVEKVSMTGSAATAKLIQRAAADTLTPSIFELGGKSPNIVFADADLDAAAFGVTIPSVYTFNAGQACVGGLAHPGPAPGARRDARAHPGHRRVDRHR